MNAMKHHILTPAIKQAVPERYLKNVESMEEDENGLTVRFRKPGKGKPGQRISVKDDYFRVVVEQFMNIQFMKMQIPLLFHMVIMTIV